MFENDETYGIKDNINNMPVPSDIDQYIINGIKKGKTRKRFDKIKRLCETTAAALLISFITLSRFSPGFAAYCSKVPGLQYIIKLVNYDKGVKAIVKNNFIQHIGLSDEHEKLVFSVNDIIIDNTKAFIFYSVEDKGNHRFIGIDEASFKDKAGNIIPACINYSTMGKDMSKEKKIDGEIELNYDERVLIPENIYMNVKLEESDNNDNRSAVKLPSEWNIIIPVDVKKFEGMKKTYILNKKVTIENQNILFKKVTIMPTQIAVEVECDKNNTKKILHFDDIKIEDEKGETYGSIENGVTGTFKDEYSQVLYFQSNYFTNPEELYITGSSIRALDKDKLTAILDIKNKKLLKSPDDKLQLSSISNYNGNINVTFNLKKDKNLDSKHYYFVFKHPITDSNGKEIKGTIGSTNGEDEGTNTIILSFPSSSKFKNPLYLTIEDYPSRINGCFKVKIK